MINKTSINVYNNQPQVLAVGEDASFTNVRLKTGNPCALTLGAAGKNVTISTPGLYLVTVNADILGTAAGNVQLQLTEYTGVNPQELPVDGAEATVTAASGDTYSVSFTALVRVLPSCQSVCNKASLAVKIGETAATISNINMVIVRAA